MEKKHSLILDDEFIKYCELNNIDDIDKLARETFKQGFTLLKYGDGSNWNITGEGSEHKKFKIPIKERTIPNIPKEDRSQLNEGVPDKIKETKKEEVIDIKPDNKVKIPITTKTSVKSSGNDLYDE